MDKNSEFGARLKRLCEEAGLKTKVAELGRKLGVSGTTAWHYMQGEKLPSMAKAIEIAEKLNCYTEYLLTGQGPKNDSEVIDLALQRLADPANYPSKEAVLQMGRTFVAIGNSLLKTVAPEEMRAPTQPSAPVISTKKEERFIVPGEGTKGRTNEH